MADQGTGAAARLMIEFAARTGLEPEGPGKRYLWTDAFAVCNFLGLGAAAGETPHRELALRLVDRVHRTLARHRDDDPRSGWISGLDETEGALHPTRGGLRIGKDLPERGPHQALDERLEWDRDGQYFHYLTKWMHALDRVSRVTGEPRFNTWARELADTAYRAFCYGPAGPGRRMYWKMSIDLTRPLVPAMGQHDPLDGYLTLLTLGSTARRLSPHPEGPDLEEAVQGLAAMVQEGEWLTADPLGVGGLLTDVHRMAELRGEGVLEDDGLLEGVLEAALAGLQYFAGSAEVRQPAAHRLPFRELGLAIGLKAAGRIGGRRRLLGAEADRLRRAVSAYEALGEAIQGFWNDPGHRRAGTWTEHRDINEVMMATCLAPEGFLG